MKTLASLEEVHSFIKENVMAILYFSSHHCSVCVDLYPKIEKLLEAYPKIAFAKIEMDSVPKAAGSLNIFTLPCVLFFIDEKEIIREARFISIRELEEKIDRYYILMQE